MQILIIFSCFSFLNLKSYCNDKMRLQFRKVFDGWKGKMCTKINRIYPLKKHPPSKKNVQCGPCDLGLDPACLSPVTANRMRRTCSYTHTPLLTHYLHYIIDAIECIYKMYLLLHIIDALLTHYWRIIDALLTHYWRIINALLTHYWHIIDALLTYYWRKGGGVLWPPTECSEHVATHTPSLTQYWRIIYI